MNYHDTVIHDIVKAFWDERGLGARFRLYQVGLSHFRQVLDHAGSLEERLEGMRKALRAQGIVGDLLFESADKVLTLEVTGCAHHEMDEALLSAGVQPVLCPIANLCMAVMEKSTGASAETATVEILPSVCRIPIILFRRTAQGAQTANA